MEVFSDYYLYPIDVTTNRSSPLQFDPTNCNITNSWVLPKVASSYIAIIGQNDNAVMTRINTYMVALQAYWALNTVNDLTLVYYDTVDDLNAYIASDTYLYPDEGICFGISVT
jgi:hypothetical protein